MIKRVVWSGRPSTPMGPGTELLLEQCGHLARFGKSTCRYLAEDELTVEEDVELAVAAGDQLECAHDRRPEAEQLAGQAHGLIKGVSRNAIFDPRLVKWRDHAPMIRIR